MKSNIIRYFLVGLMTAVCCATAGNTYAFKLGSLQASNVSRSDIGSTYGKVCIQNNSFYQGYGTLIKQGYTFGSYGGSSTCINYAMGANSIYQEIYTNPIGDSSSHGYFYTSLVSFESDNQGGYNFKYYDINNNTTQTFNVPSIAGFTYTLTNGQNVLFDEVYFWHDSIIFMNSESHYTLQLIGTTLLENLVVYADPFASSDNLYLIDFNAGKARSSSLASDYVASILFNAVDISNNLLFNEINWSKSYTLSAGSTSVFPLTAGNLCSGDGCKQSNGGYSSNMWSYNLDLDFVSPDYGDNNNNESSYNPPVLSGSINNYESIEKYNSCVDRYLFVSDTSAFWYSCRSDYEDGKLTREQFINLQDYILNINSLTPYTGNTYTENCNMFVDVSEAMYEYHSGTYNVDINLAYRGSSNPDGIDLTYICGSKPEESSADSGLSWWQNLLNQIGVGGSVSGSGNVLDSAYNGFISIIRNPLNNYVINPIQDEYNSGYNVMNQTACISSNNSFAYGDYILYFGVVLISLILFGIFI